MIDHELAQLALRNRLLTLVVATTGSTTLAATSTGYTRAAGSFLTDGFRVGMEIVPSGFPANPVDVIKQVTDTVIATVNTHAASAAALGRAITSGVPQQCAWDNVPVEPVVGRPYLTEQFVPATSTLYTTAANQGHGDETGLYVIGWYGLTGGGPHAIRRSIQALRALFTSGTALSVGSSDTIRVRGKPGPFSSGLVRHGGWTRCMLTIPWIAYVRNVVV